MRNSASQDAYARFDIQNLLGQYDTYWYSQFNKAAQATPAMSYNRVSLYGSYANGDDLFVKDWFLTKAVLDNKTQLKNRQIFKPEDTFFYGSIALFGKFPDAPNNIPNTTIQLKVDNGAGLIAPVADISNGNAPNSQLYGSGIAQDNLFNKMKFVDQGGSPLPDGFLLLDGILFGIPRP